MLCWGAARGHILGCSPATHCERRDVFLAGRCWSGRRQVLSKAHAKLPLNLTTCTGLLAIQCVSPASTHQRVLIHTRVAGMML